MLLWRRLGTTAQESSSRNRGREEGGGFRVDVLCRPNRGDADSCGKRLEREWRNCSGSGARVKTYYGQPDGKVGLKVVHPGLCEPETPPSPDEKRMLTPRAPRAMKLLHRLLNKRD